MNILDQLAAHARERVEADKKTISPEEMRELAGQAGPGSGKAFAEALAKPGLSFICEIKKASPSKGVISPDFPYLEIAKTYEKIGADAISCLTEPKWFMGSDDIFREIRAAVSTPMIRKDFTVDEYQIYQAKTMGASAVLLICGLLDTETIARYLGICEELGLAALVETHTEEEIESAVAAGARIIGVNNRDLRDFSVDFTNAARLRDKIPPECIYVAESGVRRSEDAGTLRKIGADAVLVGEALMRAEDKKALLQAMRWANSGATEEQWPSDRCCGGFHGQQGEKPGK